MKAHAVFLLSLAALYSAQLFTPRPRTLLGVAGAVLEALALVGLTVVILSNP